MLYGSVFFAVGSATTFAGPGWFFQARFFEGDLLHDRDGDLLEVRQCPPLD